MNYFYIFCLCIRNAITVTSVAVFRSCKINFYFRFFFLSNYRMIAIRQLLHCVNQRTIIIFHGKFKYSYRWCHQRKFKFSPKCKCECDCENEFVFKLMKRHSFDFNYSCSTAVKLCLANKFCTR